MRACSPPASGSGTTASSPRRASLSAPISASSRACRRPTRRSCLHIVFYCELERSRERLWRVRGFFDVYGAAVELGILPRPGTLGERALMMFRGYGLRGLRPRGA